MYIVKERKQTCTSFKCTNETFHLFFKNKQDISLVFLKYIVQLEVSLGTGEVHCGVDKGLDHEVIYKIINSVILHLVLQLLFSSVSSANSFINSSLTSCRERQTCLGLV